MAATLYVDESLHRGFRLAAVRVDPPGASRARARMRDQLPPGTRRLHFVKENEGNRRRAFAAIESLGLDHLIFEAPRARHLVDQRTAAVRQLITWSVGHGIDRVVFERDDNSIALDRRVVADTLSRLGTAHTLEYAHVAASSEPLLWIPDAVAWAWSRGGDWRRRAEAAGVTRIDA